MKSKLILDLNEITSSDFKQVGGKAASLSDMVRSKIPVPPGYVITTNAFSRGMDDELKQEILKRFDMLGSKRVAVRSSALVEDSKSASWAGLLESYLPITREELIEAVEKCRSSIHSTRAQKYAHKHRVRDGKKTVAVIVQAMVESDVSGVLFSTNPISNDHSEFLIESAYGLGELLVQGKITPETITATRDGQIVNRKASKQQLKLVYEAGETKKIAMKPPGKILTAVLVKKLVILGEKIEEQFGLPQDIEWTIEAGKFYILQSRPVTTLGKKPQMEDGTITWVTAVARRHTPLLLSFVISGQQDHLLSKHQIGLPIQFSKIRRKGYNLQYDKADLETCRVAIKREISKNSLTFFDTYSKQCLDSCQEFLDIGESIERQQLKESNLPCLKIQLQRYFDAAISHAIHLIVLISVQFELEDFLNNFIDERISDLKHRVHIMNSLKITNEPTHEIANLERLIELGQLVQKTVPAYKEWIVADPYILKEQIVKEFHIIWKNITQYQKDFGWMGRMYYAGNPITEVDIIVRLQNSLRYDCDLRLNKIQTERKRQLAEREQSIIELGGDIESRLLADTISRYMHLRTYRLNVYFIAHQQVFGLLTKAAKMLGLKGGVEDIIFLDWREIIAGLNKRVSVEELRNDIIKRQQGFEFLSLDGKTEWSSLTILKGMTACLGTYTGRVRLLLNDEAMVKMIPGEVLVTTMTTPSLMLGVEKAGAIVTDEGGMLCHAAIVSRELNIPCIIGTQNATNILNDGDIIEVDANNGIVKKL